MILDNGISKLELVWRTRSGGSGKTWREYLDFVVDGQSLQDLIDPGDLIGCLGWLPEKEDANFVDRLLLKKPSILGNDRHLIYICPECGDVDCGAISVQIYKSCHEFIWSNFGFEKDTDSRINDLKSYVHVGPFHFDKHEYWNTITHRPGTTAIPIC